MTRLVALGLCLLLAGCSTTEKAIPSSGYLLPNASLKMSPSISLPLEKVVTWGAVAGLAYLVLDPLAPNWKIEEAPLGDDHVHFSLRMKRFYTGGTGEAHVVFHRRAKELMRLNGFTDYKVIEYNEGMDSSVLGSQRTAQGVVVLTKKAG